MKIPKLLFVIGLFTFVTSCQPKETGKPKTILVVLAHPDDETGFSSALAYYARLGHTVQLIFAVDGRFDRRFVDVEPDSVAKAKQRDVVCSCEKLGIASPIFYRFNTMDRKHGERDGVRNAVETGSAFREKLKQSMEQLKPDLIITFGPDGEYSPRTYHCGQSGYGTATTRGLGKSISFILLWLDKIAGGRWRWLGAIC